MLLSCSGLISCEGEPPNSVVITEESEFPSGTFLRLAFVLGLSCFGEVELAAQLGDCCENEFADINSILYSARNMLNLHFH